MQSVAGGKGAVRSHLWLEKVSERGCVWGKTYSWWHKVKVNRSILSSSLGSHELDCLSRQAPLSTGFSWQEYGVGCHFLLQGSSRSRDWARVSCTEGRPYYLSHRGSQWRRKPCSYFRSNSAGCEKNAWKSLGLEYTCMSMELPGMARSPCRLESTWGGLAALRLLCVRASGMVDQVLEEPHKNLGNSRSDWVICEDTEFLLWCIAPLDNKWPHTWWCVTPNLLAHNSVGQKFKYGKPGNLLQDRYQEANRGVKWKSVLQHIQIILLILLFNLYFLI